MTAPRDHPMIGKWRITEMELWDAEFIDLLGPGYIQFDPDDGHFAFCAVQGGLDCHYGQASIHFTWAGHDDMDETPGDGDAQLEDDGTLTGDIRFHLGGESSFAAKMVESPQPARAQSLWLFRVTVAGCAKRDRPVRERSRCAGTLPRARGAPNGNCVELNTVDRFIPARAGLANSYSRQPRSTTGDPRDS